ncbi:MAG: TIGR04255 family protein [Planctomycetaceae bacterium]|nr:TIGR04255 family protein [Planctomycetaceae bacterium]
MASINFNEAFPHLSKAPIVEAVIAISFAPDVAWNEANLQRELKQRLPDFPKVESLHAARYQLDVGKQTNSKVENFGCVGFKVCSIDGLHIAQFNKDAFVFSRLNPYQDWEQLSGEAFRLLSVYNELIKPKKVMRIGLRFINRITIKQEKVELADYYKYPPESLKELDWALTGYLHHDLMQVSGTAYSVNLIKTVQNNVPGEIGLILDIDVFMQNMQDSFVYNERNVKECLEEMRWVKNKIFFGSLTDKTIQELK